MLELVLRGPPCFRHFVSLGSLNCANIVVQGGGSTPSDTTPSNLQFDLS